MYLWKVDHLAADLNNDHVSQKEQFKYTLVFTLINTLAMVAIAFGSSEMSSGLMAVDLVVTLVITAAGISYCYHCNRQADDRDLIVRFICLGLPVTVRIIVFGALLGFVVGAVTGLVLGESAAQDAETGFGVRNLVNLMIGYVVQLAYFVYLGRWMGAVSTT